MHGCVELLIEKDLIPHIVGGDNAEFKAMVWSDPIQVCISRCSSFEMEHRQKGSYGGLAESPHSQAPSVSN